MLDGSHTHALGLRGLHIEARRRGDHAAALEFAVEAHKPRRCLGGQAVLDDRAARGDWAAALACRDQRRGEADRQADRQPLRAVLQTAMALERAEREPKAALALAQEAARSRPASFPPPRSPAG